MGDMRVGDSLANHADNPPSYIPNADPGRFGGGTYTGQSVEPTMEAYENIFGPSARDIKQDLQRFKRHGRWHLPDILKGPNQYLTDRVDGLITDAASSPFTSRILPYKYITNVDGKIKWNVWSFDEGLSSRVPYESAARTLQQSKRSYAGYTVRQGMAIVLEHNFMMTDTGRENFRRQLNQLVGSIQLTNDLDVHVALVLAPSYQKTMNEKYLTQDKTATQICREFVDMFGFVQKNQNALDILIEEAKAQLRTWGAAMPDFMLCNSKLTFQLTMTPDATNYVTKGAEGVKRLRTGPDLPSYRGIGIVHTRAFSMETGAPPRDILRRRVRVAEYYRITPHRDNHRRLFQFYNEERDTWSTFTFQDLLHKAQCDRQGRSHVDTNLPGAENSSRINRVAQALSAPVHVAHEGHDMMCAAHKLGAHINIQQGSSESLNANLSTLFKQIFTGKLKDGKEFYFEPKFIYENVVYVPGAMDCSGGTIYDDNNLQTVNNYFFPSFIEFGLNSIRPDLQGAAGHELNKARIQIQSVAMYPRDNATFIGDILRDTATVVPRVAGTQRRFDRFVFPNYFINEITEANAAPTNYTNEVRILKRKLALRNFKRYGIPNAILKNTWRKNMTKLSEVFNLTVDTNFANQITFTLDEQLRDLGAWNCPNHFKGRVPAFTNAGDLLGYNILIHNELLESLSKIDSDIEQEEDKSIHQKTFLFDIIINKDKYQDLYRDVHNLLTLTYDTMKTSQDAGNKWSRLDLTNSVHHSAATGGTGDLQLILQNHQNESLTHDFNISLINQGGTNNWFRNDFWLWPRTENTKEEVFSNDPQVTASRPWIMNLHGVAQFATDKDLTWSLVNVIHQTGAFPRNNPLNETITIPAHMQPPTEQDVSNFFNMLAWRLFADQEIPLTRVYNPITAVWPQFSDYCYPSQGLSGRQFGLGLMTYDTPPGGPPSGGPSGGEWNAARLTEDVEIVVVRPNIEHYMMGIILGQGGESLGSTFWGQTELSCYDDSMHGIWGMSYKYNERAIVINERNLVRLWDIAYDGYVGGKDDSCVDWNDDDASNAHSRQCLVDGTMDVTRPYRGPSMMVMAFHHEEGKRTAQSDGNTMYKKNFKPNWPSPIVFYDRLDKMDRDAHTRADFDNIHVVEAQQFRVFNNELYKNGYSTYQERMPDFWDLHKIRKNAGLAAVENEVSSEALAFQGTMRVLSADNGGVIQEIQGSGHHGPDFIGVASLRAGKGYKINSQPTIQRLV